jgi:D-alanyl-D-alanine carboxypeptidase
MIPVSGRSRRIAGAAFVLALACGLCGAANAQTLPASAALTHLRSALQRDLDAYVRERSAAEHLSSLSLTVSLRKNLPAMNVTSGTSRYRGGARVTPASLYQVGSITKAFTAVAVLQLEAQGRVSIDAPIGTYLPQYPSYAKITLRQLLHMTGGLETYDNLPVWYANYVKDPMAYHSADSLIRLVYPKKKFAAGTHYYYSNTGYLLAQEVVAARSASHSFEKEMARIIDSVGLKNTYYSSNLYAPPIASRIVAGYYENDDPGFKGYLGRDMSKDSLSWAQGAGSIVSTPADITTWARALYQGTGLLPPLQRRELMSLVSIKTARPLTEPTASDPAGFGLGVAKRFDPHLGTFWFYQGETLGFRAAHLYFPQRDLVVAIFANSRPIEAKSKLPSLFATIDKSIRAAFTNQER